MSGAETTTKLEVLRDLSERVHDAGGRALLVGGGVRDLVRARLTGEGWTLKDLDVEVFGLTGEQLLAVAEGLGRVDVCGQSFAVVKVWVRVGDRDVDVDLSLPRRESKVAEGHRGFAVEGLPGLSVEEACRRRDFTAGAMAWDVRTGELVDPFGGREDVGAGVLRATSDAFGEDPLRVLRGMQFAARFGWHMDSETVRVCRSMRGELAHLSKDRVWGEWRKLALADTPSAGLRVLRETGWLDGWKELAALVGLEQDSEWHPEGSVWEHTLLAVDEAARMSAFSGLEDGDRVVAVLAALCHDLGKAVTTTTMDGRVVSPGHAKESARLARDLLRSLGAPRDVEARVVALVGAHMWHLSGVSDRAVRRWSRKVRPATLGALTALMRADAMARGGASGVPEQVEELERAAERLGLEEQAESPLLMGRHLLDLGMSEGPEVGQVLREAFEVQLDEGWTTEAQAVEWARGRMG